MQRHCIIYITLQSSSKWNNVLQCFPTQDIIFQTKVHLKPKRHLDRQIFPFATNCDTFHSTFPSSFFNCHGKATATLYFDAEPTVSSMVVSLLVAKFSGWGPWSYSDNLLLVLLPPSTDNAWIQTSVHSFTDVTREGVEPRPFDRGWRLKQVGHDVDNKNVPRLVLMLSLVS